MPPNLALSPAGTLLALLCALAVTASVTSSNVGCPAVRDLSGPSDRRQDLSSLTVATFNSEWLFDGVGDRLSPWNSASAAEEHVDRVAATLKRHSADVINMVEVESCAMLQSVMTKIGDPTYEAYLVQGKDTATRQNVGLITRVDPSSASHNKLKRTEARHGFPAAASNCGSGIRSGTSGVSKHYWTVLDIPVIGEVLLLSAHLLAVPTQNYKCAKREAQALVLRDIIQKEGLQKGRAVIVCGDFNDFDEKTQDVSGNTPTSRVLQFLRDANPEESGEELVSVMERVATPQRYTDWYDRNRNGIDDGETEYGTLDYILVTRNLMGRLKKAWVDHGNAMGREDSRTSDHWPLYATFDLRVDPNGLASGGAGSDVDTPIGWSSYTGSASLFLVVCLTIVGALLFHKYVRGLIKARGRKGAREKRKHAKLADDKKPRGNDASDEMMELVPGGPSKTN